MDLCNEEKNQKFNPIDVIRLKNAGININLENFKLNPLTKKYDYEGSLDLSGKGLSEIPVKFGKVTGNFNCYDNPLASLQGCPQEVCGNFNCSCNLLTSLDYAPEYVGRNFNCYKNLISDISTIPTKYIGGDFYARGENNTFEITDELRKIVKGDIYK